MNAKRSGVCVLPFLLAAPVAVYVGACIIVPILQALYTSLTRTELLGGSPPVWVGLANYRRLIVDAGFWHALLTTGVYTVLVVGFVLAAATGTALLLSYAFRWRTLARGLVTIPWAFPEVAAVIVWGYILNQNFGVLNWFVRWLPGASDTMPWMTHPKLAMLSIILVTTWKIFPFYSLVILAALQGVSTDLYEAARIDGANSAQSFWHVTLPGIVPTLLILAVLATIFSFRRFTVIYLLTGGGPAAATETLVIRVYDTAFKFFELGYGSAIGVGGLIASLVVAGCYLRLQRRWALETI